jgi:hypothetical protein
MGGVVLILVLVPCTFFNSNNTSISYAYGFENSTLIIVLSLGCIDKIGYSASQPSYEPNRRGSYVRTGLVPSTYLCYAELKIDSDDCTYTASCWAPVKS